jgi:hypothetical protein
VNTIEKYFRTALKAIFGLSVVMEENIPSNFEIGKMGNDVFLKLVIPFSGNFNVLDFSRKLQAYLEANMDNEIWNGVGKIVFVHEIASLGAKECESKDAGPVAEGETSVDDYVDVPVDVEPKPEEKPEESGEKEGESE